jgi:hypothetical protein
MANENPKPEMTPFEKELSDKTDGAWDLAIKAILDYATAHGELMHYRGYILGRKMERDEMQAAMAKAASEAAAKPAPVSTAVPSTFVLQNITRKAKEAPPANEIVLNAIKANPGTRGVELLRKIRQTYPSLLERTFRTALHRLKHAGDIYIDNYEWWHKNAGPKVTLQLFESGPPPDPKDKGGQL